MDGLRFWTSLRLITDSRHIWFLANQQRWTAPHPKTIPNIDSLPAFSFEMTANWHCEVTDDQDNNPPPPNPLVNWVLGLHSTSLNHHPTSANALDLQVVFKTALAPSPLRSKSTCSSGAGYQKRLKPGTRTPLRVCSAITILA